MQLQRARSVRLPVVCVASKRKR
eukprot:COSAG05_NODE_15564_length_366_cov_1.161049_1_plen_22_part_01